MERSNIHSTGGVPAPNWLRTLRRYLVFVAVANLFWEILHIPLYTIWETGTASELLFAVVYCTGGDVLIGTCSVMLALFFAGDATWPSGARVRVTVLTVLFGLSYTIFSEWLNIVVRQAWAYRDIMPVVPVIDTGLTPLLQWIVIPVCGFWWAMREPSRYRRTMPEQGTPMVSASDTTGSRNRSD